MALEKVEVKLTANLDNLKSGLNQAKGRVSNFSKVGAVAFRAVSIAAGATGVAIAGMVTFSLKAFSEFSQGMANVATLFEDLDGQIRGQLTEGVREMATEFGVSTADLNKSLFDIVSATGDTVNAIDNLEAATALAVAGNSSLVDSTSGLLTLMSSYEDSLGGVKDASDLLFKAQEISRASVGELAKSVGQFLPIAKELGVTAEDAFAVFAKGTTILGSAAKASVGVKGVFTALLVPTESMKTALGELAEEFEEMGDASAQAGIDAFGLPGLLEKLGQKTQFSTAQLFANVEGLQLAAPLLKDANALREASATLMEREGSVERALAIQKKELAFQTNVLGSEFNELKLVIGEQLSPIMSKLLERHIIPAIAGMGDWIKQNPQFIASLKDVGTTIGLNVEAFTLLIEQVVLITKFWFDFFVSLEDSLPIIGHVKDTIEAIAFAMDFWAERITSFLTVKKKERDALKASVKAQEEAIKANTKLGKAEKIKADAIQAGLDAVANLTDAEKKMIKAHEDAVIASGEASIQAEAERQIVEELTQQYVELLLQLQDGKITQEEFADSAEGLVQSMAKVKGSLKAALDEFRDLNASELSLDVDVRIKADKGLNDIRERIIDTQNQILLNNLEGEARAIKVAELNHQKKLRFIEDELRAEERKLQFIIVTEEARFLAIEENLAAIAIAEQKTQAQVLAVAQAARDSKIAIATAILKATKDLLSQEALAHLELTNQIIKQNGGRVDSSNKVIDALDRENKAIGRVLISSGSGSGGGSSFGNFAGLGAINGVASTFGSTPTSTSPSVTSVQQTASAFVAPRVLVSNPTVPGFAHGSDFVPRTGMFKLHRGEKVVSAGENSIGGGGGGGEVTVINLIDPAMVPQIMGQFPNAILNVVNSDILNNGETRRVLRSVD